MENNRTACQQVRCPQGEELNHPHMRSHDPDTLTVSL